MEACASGSAPAGNAASPPTVQEHGIMSPLINTTVKPFKATAYHNGKFVPVTDADLKGKWSVVFFYPADFTFVCPTELGDLADHYATLKDAGRRSVCGLD
jgi:alkyl hydroperoxide reductase subunit AhpC